MATKTEKIFSEYGVEDWDLTQVPMKEIDSYMEGSSQPRMEIRNDIIERLINVIKSDGEIEPVIVRAQNGRSGQYDMVSGFHRYEAFTRAGQEFIQAYVVSATDFQAELVGIADNTSHGVRYNEREEDALIVRQSEVHGMSAEAISAVTKLSTYRVNQRLKVNEARKRFTALSLGKHVDKFSDTQLQRLCAIHSDPAMVSMVKLCLDYKFSFTDLKGMVAEVNKSRSDAEQLDVILKFREQQVQVSAGGARPTNQTVRHPYHSMMRHGGGIKALDVSVVETMTFTDDQRAKTLAMCEEIIEKCMEIQGVLS